MHVIEEPRPKPYRLTVEQYERMGEAQVFEREARVELIEGRLVQMASIGSRHFSAVSRLNRLFVPAVGDRALVSIQQPLRLDRYSEPVPDVAVLKPRDDFYAGALPSGRDAFLVIEVADSSVRYDLRRKARLYAAHGVPAYWVFDLTLPRLHGFSASDGTAYRDEQTFTELGRIELPGLDGCSVDLAGLF